MEWKKNDKRFVAFFDILGFKEMVGKFEHHEILEKLELLKSTAERLETLDWGHRKDISNVDVKKGQTRSVTFSDTLIFFSNGDKIEDFVKILMDSKWLLEKALKNGIAIKGAISFGEITVDFDKFLFFGQPIIDAYLLHEDLHVLGVILDHNAENQIRRFGKNPIIKDYLLFTKVKLKYGMTSHTILCYPSSPLINNYISLLTDLYKITSGQPRLYIDNTIDFLNKLLELKKKA